MTGPQNSALSIRSTSLRSTITRPARVLRNLFMPSTVARVATHSADSSLTATLKALPPAKEIPTTLVGGIKTWWEAGASATARAEERLLRYVPAIHLFGPPRLLIYSPRRLSYYCSKPPLSLSEVSNQPVIAYTSKIVLDDQKRYINTLSITSTSPRNSSPAPAVLLHGHFEGLGVFTKNFPALGEWAASRQSSVYAIDWLGFGRSARVPFVVNAKRDDIPGRVREAEAFFIDSLEEWRERMELEKMTLVGHEFGAYMSVAYALKYPTRVSRLVLLSPDGVLRDPNTTVPSYDQNTEADNILVGDTQLAIKPVERITSEQRGEGKLLKVAQYLLEERWSPLRQVRAVMWYNPIIVGTVLASSLPELTEEELKEAYDYFLNITLTKGSGEYCYCG